jgi:hypothetical protein
MSTLRVDTIANTAGDTTQRVLQVVNATYGTQISTASSTYIDTGLTATITPSSTDSKILILVSHNGIGKMTSNTGANQRIVKDGSPLTSFQIASSWSGSSSHLITSSGIVYLDSPASTSAITYKTQFSSYSNTGTIYMNGNTGDLSSITLMEIAG